jgi:hypothetical protein
MSRCAKCLCVAFVAVVLATVSEVLYAQAVPRGRAGVARPDDGQVGAPAAGKVQIRRLLGVGSRGRVFTPVYNTNVGRGTRPARQWGSVTVVYETTPEWIDEMTITYYAMSLDKTSGENKYSLYRKEVPYMDIARDRNHTGVVYIRPSALERFGEIVACAVEIRIDNEVVAQQGESSMGGALPDEWWKDQRVIGRSDLVTIRDAHILNRIESPFAFINIDDYEAIK